MKQQKRKGFTLVELLIVIAILAVLATVSIVGYTSFIRKAHVSNDTALAKQINDLLMADEVADGKSKTLGEALAVVDENGFDVTKLTPTALGHEFVYDIEHNRFALLDENQMVIYSAGELSKDSAKLWTIVNDISVLTENYAAPNSLYITKNVENLTLSKLVGVEVANGCTIENLTITDNDTKASVVLAGNIGTTTIEARQGEVDHHGVVGTVNINVLKHNSWHEYGTVTGNINVADGHLVLTDKAVVNAVVAVDSKAEISIESGATYNEVVKTVDGAKVEIDGKETEVPTIDAGNLSKFAGGLGTEKSPYLIENSTQFKGIVNGASTKEKKYYNLISDIEFTEDQIEKANISGNDFSVYHAEKLMFVSIDGQGHRLISNVSVAKIFGSVRDAKFINLEVEAKSSFVTQAYNVTFDNVDTYGKLSVSANYAAYVMYGSDLKFYSCTNYATIIGTGTSSDYNAIFVGFADSNAMPAFTFKNCSNEGSITCGKAALFLGNSAKAYTIKMTIENCSNKGTINATYADSTYNMNYYVATSAKNLKLNGTKISISGTLDKLPNACDGSDQLIENTGRVVNGANTDMALTKNADGTFNLIGATDNKINGTVVATYEIRLGVYVEIENGTSRFYVVESITATSENNYTSNIKDLQFVDKTFVGATEIAADANGNRICTISGTTYYVVADGQGTNGVAKSAQMCSVAAYDAAGNLLASVALTK